MSDAWYLNIADYYVPQASSGAHPSRQGDIFAAPSGLETWTACQLIHPTCDLAKASVNRVQIIRVYSLDAIADEKQKSGICAGWVEKDGKVQVAYANTFFLAPIATLAGDIPLFADFRQMEMAVKNSLLERRVAALTHEARVSFMRRELYFRYRLRFSFDEVKSWEAARIAVDPHFEGPRPTWALPPEAREAH